MDEKVYKITLANGAKIENLVLNGNNFISENEITSEMFDNNLSPVVISDGETDEIHDNMALVQITDMNGKKAFILRDISETELRDIKNRADIEYIAMMASIDL